MGTRNYRRFYAAFNKLQHYGDDEGMKEELVSRYTRERTTHLSEMSQREYTALCKALEDTLGYGDQRRRQRSICLRLMQELGIDTTDWQRINDFCLHPRIAGKVFAQLDIRELEALERKLRAIKRKGGLGEAKNEERGVKNGGDADHVAGASKMMRPLGKQHIIIIRNGNNDNEPSEQLLC